MENVTLTARAVGKTGYYLPWSILSAILVAVAAGLISTFTPHTSTVKWIMYQVIGGIGRGCGLQMVSTEIAQCFNDCLTCLDIIAYHCHPKQSPTAANIDRNCFGRFLPDLWRLSFSDNSSGYFQP